MEERIRHLTYTGWMAMVCLLLAWGVSSCSPDDGDDTPPPPPIPYTTLVYMMADNSMDKEVDFTISQLKEGARHSAGTVVIYLDRKDAAPRLFKLTQQGVEVPLREYPERNSADAGTLAAVLEETADSVPAEHYGLVLWSHAMGWLPYSYDPYSASASVRRSMAKGGYPGVRYVGMDNEPGADTTFPTIEVDGMAKALADSFPGRKLDYIWFDACLMGGVEVAYQLRNACDYVVASPTDVLADAEYNASGIPYSKVLPYMFGGESDLRKASEIYMAYYRGMKVKWRNSATLTVVKSAEMQGLYDEAGKLLDGKLPLVGGMDVSGIQPYFQSATAIVPNPPEPPYFFDLKGFMDRISGGNDASFVDRLNKAIVYTGATDYFIELPIDHNRYSGLSVYIPLEKWSGHDEYRYYFKNMAWSGVYGDNPVK